MPGSGPSAASYYSALDGAGQWLPNPEARGPTFDSDVWHDTGLSTGASMVER
jgi:hypothetical protein